jgi:hypothetical protein
MILTVLLYCLLNFRHHITWSLVNSMAGDLLFPVSLLCYLYGEFHPVESMVHATAGIRYSHSMVHNFCHLMSGTALDSGGARPIIMAPANFAE